jgi:hypothetical protein
MSPTLSMNAHLALEAVSRVIETHPGLDARSIRTRARMSRERGDAVIARLLRDGFIGRERFHAEWIYRSVNPYRASVKAQSPGYGSSHATRQGGDG